MKEILNIAYLKQHGQVDVDTNSYALYYVLRGNVSVRTSVDSYEMKLYDVVFVNPKDCCKLQFSNALVARIQIERNALSYLTNRQGIYFICNTVKEKNENFVELRHLLDKLINTMFEDDFQKLLYHQCSYNLIVFLVTKFSNNIFVHAEYDRKSEIQAFIHMNYQNDVSLELLADHFGLSPQYFSKYFKENFHMTFLKYLNMVRVESARSQMIRCEDTVIKIALENGFPNLASFTRVFHSHYGELPAQYRLLHKHEAKCQELSNEEVKGCLQHLDIVDDEHKHIANIDANAIGDFLDPYWFHLFNLGQLSTLLKDDMKEQIRELQKELGFQYARIFLDVQPSLTKNTYYIEEKVFDFLFEVHFKIHLVIDYRLYAENESFISYLEGMLYHFVNRYGLEQIQIWQFELFYDSDFSFVKAKQYKAFYEKINNLLGKIGLSDRLSGPGILLDEGGENLKRFLNILPDIETLTISIAPYTIRSQEDGGIFINRTTDTNYLMEQYELAKSISSGYNDGKHIQIVSWKDSLNEMNILNDSSYRASRILSNTIKGYRELETLAIDKPLDLMFDDMIDNTIFSGLSGLISKKGVKKASFYAYKFLKKMDTKFLYKDSHMLATCSDKKYLQIVCHNCKKLSYKFYSEETERLKENQIVEYFEDNEMLHISFHFQNLLDGEYILKYRSISEEDGSALSKWQDMKFEHSSFFGIDEMEYLTSVSKPSIKGLEVKVKSGLLDVEIALQPNEIRHIHLIYIH